MFVYGWCEMNSSDNVLMNRNVPDPNPANNISDRMQRCVRPGWEIIFSSNKDNQRFGNLFYRCDSIKVDNTRSSRQKLLKTSQNCQNMPTKKPCQY